MLCFQLTTIGHHLCSRDSGLGTAHTLHVPVSLLQL